MRKLFIRSLNFFVILSIVSILAGCGFHIRNKNEITKQFNHIKLINKDVPDLLASKISNLFNGLGIISNNEYNYKFIISNYQYQLPSVTSENNNYPMQMSATASMSYQILNRDNTICLANQVVSVSQNITVPAGSNMNNQIDPMTQIELNKSITEQMFQVLSSNGYKKALLSPQCRR